MGDQGILCTICNGTDHKASSCPKRNRFRAVTDGRWLTRRLFEGESETPLYTLQDDDTQYPSLRRLYLSCKDLTEYEFATTYLGGWEHWQAIIANKWFVEGYLQRWRTELELLLKSEALKRIREEAEADGRNAFAANKFIVSQGWIDKTAEPSRRGRPSKAEIHDEALRIAQDTTRINEDFNRLVN